MRRVILLLFLLGVQCPAWSRNDLNYSDAGMWFTLGLDYKLNKKWSILVAEEIRFRENYSRLNLFYTNLGVEREFGKHWKTSLVYRNIQRMNLDNSFIIRHRLMWDASARTKYRDFSFSYRHRLQVEYRGINSVPTGKVPEWYSRHKFEIGYQYSKTWEPYVSAEFRYQIQDPRNEESEHTWHRARVIGGVNYKLNKRHKFGAYYLVQRVFNVSNLEHLYITGLEYNATLFR